MVSRKLGTARLAITKIIDTKLRAMRSAMMIIASIVIPDASPILIRFTARLAAEMIKIFKMSLSAMKATAVAVNRSGNSMTKRSDAIPVMIAKNAVILLNVSAG